MKMKKTSLNTTKVTDRKIKRLYLVAATVVAAALLWPCLRLQMTR